MSPICGPNNESYTDFYADWSRKQEEHLHDLQHALAGDMKEEELRQLVLKVQEHYENYYQVKDRAAQQSVLHVITPEWRSPLEKAFMWIGGWRPSMVFQLLYAQAGQQVEAELIELLEGIDSPTLAALSSKQLAHISKLQEKTHQEERTLCHRMGTLQQSMADQPLVGLAMDNTEKDASSTPFEDAVNEKLKALEDLLLDADNLRMSTLKGMLNILSSLQGAQFLIAAAMLHIVMRQIGEKKQALHD